MPRTTVHDRWLFFLTGGLLLVGLTMVFSVSAYEGLRSGQAPYFLGLKQLVWLAIGSIAGLAAMHVPYRALARPELLASALVGVVGLLVVVLFMPARNGSHRWIEVGPFTAQPSELAKLVLVVFTARFLANKENRIGELRTLAPWAVVLGLVVGLVLLQPDFGTAVLLVAPLAVMLFVAGLPWRYTVPAAGLGAAACALFVALEDYRLDRVMSFVKGEGVISQLDWQIRNSVLALGNGGIAGVGLGQSKQKAYFLAEAHTDFIYSIIGEEFGLVGALAILVAFLIVLWRGLRTAWRAPDAFGGYLALGLTVMVVLQALVNMAVCVRLVPTTGLSLPLVSYGGSSLVTTLVAMGLLLNVSQHGD